MFRIPPLSIKFKKLLIFVLITASSGLSSLFSQSKTLNFDHIRLGKGQDVNFVYKILQDSQGFIWFGTLNGLIRYDGFHIKHYPFDPNGNSQIKGRRINALLEDASKNIWIVAGNRLQVLNPKLDSFFTFSDLGVDSLLQYSDSKYNELLLQDSSGKLWLRSNRGLFAIQEQKKGKPYLVKIYKHDPDDPTSLSNDKINSLLLDQHERLWIATEHGLNYYDEKNDKVIPLDQPFTAPITSLCETDSGKICIGTSGSGVWIFDPVKKVFKNYLPPRQEGTSAKDEIVRQIVRDGKGNIWLFSGSSQTNRFTLQQFDPQSGHFTVFFEPFETLGFFASSAVHLFVDQAGYLWVVTGVGLKRFDPYQNRFEDIQQQNIHLQDWTLPCSFLEDRTGSIWIGTRSRGLLKYAPSTQKFRVYPPDPQEGDNVTGNLIKSIYEDSHGFLWVRTVNGTNRYLFNDKNEMEKVADFPFHAGTFLEDKKDRLWIGSAEGLKCFDMELQKLIPTSGFPNIDRVHHLCLEDKEGWFWSPTRGKGLLRYNPVSGEIITFRHDPNNPRSISSNTATASLVEDEEGNVWINGLNGFKKYDPVRGDFSNYLKGIETVKSIEGDSGTFWLTTTTHGFFRFDKNTGEHKHYSRKDGVPTTRFRSIFKGTGRDLWITSDVGIIQFNTDTEEIYLYDESDGLPSPVFAYGSGQRKNGEFFFPLWEGGFIRFHPDSLTIDSIPPIPAIVEFRLLNKPVQIGNGDSPLKKAIWLTEQLYLKHWQNSFTLKFSAFHYAAPKYNEFRYMMNGIDENWLDPEGQQTVNYAGLAPGKYSFQLKAANHDHIWSDPVVLNITILPPWWHTWWAYLVYAVLTLSLIWRFIIFQRRRWYLSAQLAMEHKEAARLKELDSLKSRFYTNITHEFRTPLTIILGMAKQVRDKPEEWFREGLEMILRNGQNLLYLVNQMLDLSRLESGAMPTRFIQGNIIIHIRYILESFHSLATSKNIDLKFVSDRENLIMDYDQDMVLSIISNLLSNAIRFTPDGGIIRLSVKEQQPEENLTAHPQSYLLLTIEDSGIGIPADKLPFIFDRFYKVDNTSSAPVEGTGVGLAVTKEMVKLLGGKITVESNLGEGTTFSIYLPISKKAPMVEETEISKPIESILSYEQAQMVGTDHYFSRLESKPSDLPILLIVEDNQDVVKYLKTLLAKDYFLEEADNGQEGLQKAVELVPDIIISDVMMPVMDGFELCQKLKEDIRTSHIPVILLTAKDDIVSKVEGLKRGADAYLAKPFNKEELFIRLQKLIELRKQLQLRYAEFTSPNPTDDPGTQMEDIFLQKLQEILTRYIGDEDFGILQLCNKMEISRPQLHRKLKALTNKSTSFYIRSFRLHRAKQLLQTTNLNVSEIAFEVGFANLSYFSRVFKEEFGISPLETRR